MEKVDVTIVGAGVVGLAVAHTFASAGHSVVVLERNASFGQEVSSRNSEVIHAGIYYPAGSLKAKLCVEGKELLYAYCEKFSIPHQRIGKMIVATCEEEEDVLDGILKKAQNNGVHDLIWQSKEDLQKKEPLVKATKALFSPSTGIIDTHSLMRSFLRSLENHGGFLSAKTRLERVSLVPDGFLIEADNEGELYSFESQILVNAAGLGAQTVAHSINGFDPALIPPLYLCKGNYFTLSGKSPFNHLIYPVPEKSGAGLGIHATLDLAGQTRFGPDTEYISEENYDVMEERRPLFEEAIRRYYPALGDMKLNPGYVGVRPKLQSPTSTFHDFVIQDSSVHHIPGLVHLFGIESPGLTSCLAIGKHVFNKVKG
ncbi:MAG: NAD(P)/FAD-dependent oxidoreductase [SAR324 cluster bacterium]|nr:NAD(P)/FAD-dependent oxidoreductase [SAR324 cluster bacterium]